MTSKREWKRRAKAAEAHAQAVQVAVTLLAQDVPENSGLLSMHLVQRGTSLLFPVTFYDSGHLLMAQLKVDVS